MLQSELFTKTRKEAPKDEEAINAQLLARGGFARKMSAGVYTYLPLGFRVLQKIAQVVREEMNAIGGEELLFPALIAREHWEKSKRWGLRVGYEFKSPAGDEVGLGWTHEEASAFAAAQFIESYKDLPRAVYQIQNKFRAEARAKSGLLRGREFLMKDLYSFHADKADLDLYYQKVIAAYKKVFVRLNVPVRLTEAGGGAFTDEYTHEFQALSPAGEDTVYYCPKCDWSQNEEVAKVKDGERCPASTAGEPASSANEPASSVCGGTVAIARGIEVGNVFKLGTRYSEAFGVQFTDQTGSKKPAVMGSYGIGVSRLLATLVELHHDERGIIWPKEASPFAVHLLVLGAEDTAVEARGRKVYDSLTKRGVEVLYDDRAVSAGEKFGDADLLGISLRAVVSAKTGDKIELKRRDSKEVKLVTLEEAMEML